MPFINYEIELDLPWSKKSEIPLTARVAGNPNANPPVPTTAAIQTGATFQMNNAKLYVLDVTLSVNDNSKILENIKQRFKRTIS